MDARLRQIADHFLTYASAAEVDPTAIEPRLMPNVFVLGTEHDGPDVRLRIRLVGTALDAVFGRPLRGSLLEDYIHGPRGRDVIAGFHHCAITHEALWMRQVVQIADKAPRYVEGVVIPLAPDRLYGGLVVGEVPDRSARPGFERERLVRTLEVV